MNLDEKFSDNAEFDRQTKLLYALIVAGKSANFADKALKLFLRNIGVIPSYGGPVMQGLPLSILGEMAPLKIESALRLSKTGNYKKLTTAILDILEYLIRDTWDLRTVTSAQLEQVYGLGPKTARFYCVWTRPEEPYAVLDVHVLRWLKNLGYNVPRQTPQSPTVYARIESIFLDEAKKRNLTPRQLDIQIWEAGAGRTQEKAI